MRFLVTDFKRFCLVFLLCLCSGASIAYGVTSYARADFTAEYERVQPGAAFDVLFHLQIDPGWHTYWVNPGDSGTAPRIKWQLPEGWQAGPLRWLPPQRLKVAHLMNYGYSWDAYHLQRFEVPKDASPGEYTLKGKASWLVCKEECIPESAEIALDIAVSDKTTGEPNDSVVRIREQMDDIPIVPARLEVSKEEVQLRLPVSEMRSQEIREAYFFPDVPGVINHAAPQRMEIAGQAVMLTVAKGELPKVDGVGGFVTLRDGQGNYSLWIKNINDTRYLPVLSVPDKPENALIYLFMAFVGGVLLNLMPCVFPVLSLKALSLISHRGALPKAGRRSAVAYAAGVIFSFAAVGAMLLALKSTGEAIGWGFQMQSPPFVAALACVMLLVSLALFGLFRPGLSVAVTMPRSEGDTDGWLASFATGVLVTVVATPCTAPFMATALGAALVQPPAVAMLIFIALGAGLAAPFVLLATVPALAGFLPRPGAWMQTFREFLGFPMLLATVWLVWVYGEQTSHTSAILLVVWLSGIAFLCWMAGKLSVRYRSVAWIGMVLLLLAAIQWPLVYFSSHDVPTATEGTSFSQQRVDALREQGRAVFVNATAAWCITCKVNERVALKSESVQQLFADKNIAYLVADWTNEDPKVTRYLQQFGRSGVPLYVYYPPGGEPQVLPQLLTPSIVREAIDTHITP